MSTDKAAETNAPAKLPSSLLLCEALGFAPQLLLDDIINSVNAAVQDSVTAMEEYLVDWMRKRDAKRKNDPPVPEKGKRGKKHARCTRLDYIELD